MANRSASRTLGLVLCGGESRRMGADKALMTLGGVPLIEYAVKAVRGVADEVRLGTGSAPRYASLGLACVLDAPGGAQAGPLVGLVAGLRAASAAGFDALVVCVRATRRGSALSCSAICLASFKMAQRTSYCWARTRPGKCIPNR